MRRIYAALGLLLLPACSTLTTGTTQSVTVISDPSGAACNVTRDGQLIGVVNPTPGSLTVSKSTKDMMINCIRQGNAPGQNIIRSEFQAATVGNLLLGGVIGLAVDAASGAMGNYPPSIAVLLPPLATTAEIASSAPGVTTMEPIYSPSELSQRGRPVRNLHAERLPQSSVISAIANPIVEVQAPVLTQPAAPVAAAATNTGSLSSSNLESTSPARFPDRTAKCTAYSYEEYLRQRRICDAEDTGRLIR